MVWYGMVWYGMVWYGICHGMVWYISHSQLTISKSFLSARLAHITPMMYPPRIVDIKANTATFSARLPKLLKTESKSIGFGATRRSLPNDVK